MNKTELIDKITDFHPSLGVEHCWSSYTGGMKDSGDWYYKKLLRASFEDLKELFNTLSTLNKPIPQPPVYTAQEQEDMGVQVKVELPSGGFCTTTKHEINKMTIFQQDIERRLLGY